MPFDNYQPVVELLRQYVEPADETQRRLAEYVGIKLPKDIPAPVAAAILREALADPLQRDGRLPPTEDQLKYLDDIRAGEPWPQRDDLPACDTRAQVSAWIDTSLARRAAEALERLQPTRGDLLADTVRPDLLGQMVSLGADGSIYLDGGRGRRIPGHRARLLARAEDTSAQARKARKRAANLRELAAPTMREPAPSKLRELAPYEVRDTPTREQVALLRQAIDTAQDERAVQRTLQNHPELLAATVTSSYGTFLLPQVSLGGKKRPDFALVVADSAGFHWTLIELESPRASLANKNGTVGPKARQAMQQIEDWREWLLNNIATARLERDRGGVGLPDIRPESPGIVFAGRRGWGYELAAGRRQGIEERNHVAIHTYDWLLDAVQARGGPKGSHPGGLFDSDGWPESLNADNPFEDSDSVDLDELFQ